MDDNKLKNAKKTGRDALKELDDVIAECEAALDRPAQGKAPLTPQKIADMLKPIRKKIDDVNDSFY